MEWEAVARARVPGDVGDDPGADDVPDVDDGEQRGGAVQLEEVAGAGGGVGHRAILARPRGLFNLPGRGRSAPVTDVLVEVSPVT